VEEQKVSLSKAPFIDRSRCTDCESCINLCPQIFKRNEETGCIEVADLPDYTEEAVQEVIAMCPGDCITFPDHDGG
jgi:ferredoxin